MPRALLLLLVLAQTAPRIRTVQVRPTDTPEVTVSATAPTVLILEDQVAKAEVTDPKARIVAAPVENVITLIVRRDLGAGERIPLAVTLKDGTRLRFTLAAGDQPDAQVRVVRAGPEPQGPTVEGLLLEAGPGGVGYRGIARGGPRAATTGVLVIGPKAFILVTTDGWAVARGQLRGTPGRSGAADVRPGAPSSRPSFALALQRPARASGEFDLELFGADGRMVAIEGLQWP